MGEHMMQGKLNLMALFAVFVAGLAVTPVFGQQGKTATGYKAPLEVPREFFNGIHVAKDDPKFQMEAQHYCSPLKSGMFQCVLFANAAAKFIRTARCKPSLGAQKSLARLTRTVCA
jgi:Protein of unknown function (DUF1264)